MRTFKGITLLYFVCIIAAKSDYQNTFPSMENYWPIQKYKRCMQPIINKCNIIGIDLFRGQKLFDDTRKMTVSKKHAFAGALFVCVVFAVYAHIEILFPDFTTNVSNRTFPEEKNKKMHIAYLRVPKTGSTTLYALLVRFGLKNELKMYIPKSFTVVGPKKQKLLLQEGNVYDIYTIHTHYNSTFFTNIVPSDSALIGSVREPIQRIVSHFFYERGYGRVKNVSHLSDKDFIHKIANNTKKYRIRKSMASFFGIKRKTDKAHIRQSLESLNSRFWLVLVLEKFNESLVLLKRTLNWSFSDILYSAQNSGKYGNINLSDKEKQKLYSTNMLDFEIYDYFKTELENKIQREGNDFHAEVLHFKNILQQVKSFCDNDAGNDSKKEFPPSKWDHRFVVLSSECELIFKLNEGVIRKRYSNEQQAWYRNNSHLEPNLPS